VPYTTILSAPVCLYLLVRAVAVARKTAMVTSRRFVRVRFGNSPRALAVAFTGNRRHQFLMVALQLVWHACGVSLRWSYSHHPGAFPNLPFNRRRSSWCAAYMLCQRLARTALDRRGQDLLIYSRYGRRSRVLSRRTVRL